MRSEGSSHSWKLWSCAVLPGSSHPWRVCPLLPYIFQLSHCSLWLLLCITVLPSDTVAETRCSMFPTDTCLEASLRTRTIGGAGYKAASVALKTVGISPPDYEGPWMPEQAWCARIMLGIFGCRLHTDLRHKHGGEGRMLSRLLRAFRQKKPLLQRICVLGGH